MSEKITWENLDPQDLLIRIAELESKVEVLQRSSTVLERWRNRIIATAQKIQTNMHPGTRQRGPSALRTAGSSLQE